MNESIMTPLPLCQAMSALTFPAWSRPAISDWMWAYARSNFGGEQAAWGDRC
jgi:hypothetical protein